MNAWFVPAALHTLAPTMDALVESLLACIVATAERGATSHFMHAFARPPPTLVIAHMLGVDPEQCPQFVASPEDIAEFIGRVAPTIEVAQPARTSLVAMNAYFGVLLAQRHADPGPDMTMKMIAAQAAGGRVATKELLAQCCKFLFGGRETTRNLLGNGMLTLLQHPAQWQCAQQRCRNCRGN